MRTYEDARRIIEKSIEQIKEVVEVDLLKSINCVITNDIYSKFDNPPFNNSAMDGYAVIQNDTINASIENPFKIQNMENVYAGEFTEKKLESGYAMKIMTGAIIPKGADSVIKVEDTSEDSDYVYIKKEVRVGENIRSKGEDFTNGAMLIKKGSLLTPYEIGVLSTIGKTKVKVYRKPCVAFFATGDELVRPDEKLQKSKIRDINSNLVCSNLKNIDVDFIDLGIVKDTKEEVENMLMHALKYDAVIMTGGVSVGERDFVSECVNGISTKILFSKTRIKPGKPITIGIYNNKPIIALPGNPVSAAIQFELFCKPILLKMKGISEVKRIRVQAIAKGSFHKRNDGKVNIVGVTLFDENNIYYAKLRKKNGSAMIGATVGINGIIILGETEEFIKDGDIVNVEVINNRFMVI